MLATQGLPDTSASRADLCGGVAQRARRAAWHPHACRRRQRQRRQGAFRGAAHRACGGPRRHFLVGQRKGKSTEGPRRSGGRGLLHSGRALLCLLPLPVPAQLPSMARHPLDLNPHPNYSRSTMLAALPMPNTVPTTQVTHGGRRGGQALHPRGRKGAPSLCTLCLACPT